jgi:glycosyltransferase involved in cell wall biosynthesis
VTTRRFLFVTTNLSGGGAERAIINIAKGLLDRGHRSRIVIFENIVSHDVPSGILAALTVEPGSRISTDWIGKRRIARKLRRWFQELPIDERPHVIISTLPFADEVVRLSGLDDVWYRIPNTLSAEIDGLRRSSWLKARRRSKRYRRLYSGERVIAVSQGVAHDLARMDIRPVRLETIYNPFDFDEIQKLAAMAEPDLPTDPFVLHVGRFQPQKRHDVLLDAYKTSGLQHRLVLLTQDSGDLRSMIASRGLESRVTIAGFRKNPFPWYLNASAVVLSSDREGMPNVLVEALICGTPVVSTDCPSGPREVLTGEMKNWLVPCGDHNALAAKMVEVVAKRPSIDPGVYAPFRKERILDAIAGLEGSDTR